jgi:hypothetical protein
MKLNGFDKYQCIVFLLFTPSDAYSYYLDVFYHAYAFLNTHPSLGHYYIIYYMNDPREFTMDAM